MKTSIVQQVNTVYTCTCTWASAGHRPRVAVCRHGSEGGCEGVSGDREDDGSLCGDRDTHLVWREEEAEITDQTRLYLLSHSGVYKYIMWCQSVQLQTVVSAVGPFTCKCKCSLVPRAWSLVGGGGGGGVWSLGTRLGPSVKYTYSVHCIHVHSSGIHIKIKE